MKRNSTDTNGEQESDSSDGGAEEVNGGGAHGPESDNDCDELEGEVEDLNDEDMFARFTSEIVSGREFPSGEFSSAKPEDDPEYELPPPNRDPDSEDAAEGEEEAEEDDDCDELEGEVEDLNDEDMFARFTSEIVSGREFPSGEFDSAKPEDDPEYEPPNHDPDSEDAAEGEEEAEEDDPIDPDVVPPPDVSIPGVALGAADVSIPDVARQAAAERFPPFWRTNDRFSNLEAASYKSEEESEEDLTFAPTESELDRGSDEDADDEDDEDEANMEEDDFEISEGEAAAVAAVWHPPSGIHRLASTTAMFAMMRDVRSPPSSRPLDRHPPSSPRSPPILCLEKEIRKISTPRLLPRPAPTPAPPSTTATSKPTPWGDGFNKGRKKGT